MVTKKAQNANKEKAKRSKSLVLTKQELTLKDAEKRKKAKQILLDAIEASNKVTTDDMQMFYADFFNQQEKHKQQHDKLELLFEEAEDKDESDENESEQEESSSSRRS